MSKYLVSFPAAAMVTPDAHWDAVVRDSHAVIEAAKAAGVYVFGGACLGGWRLPATHRQRVRHAAALSG